MPFYKTEKDNGLEVLYTLHSDLLADPLYPTAAKKVTHDKQMANYEKKLGSNWPFLADRYYHLKPFFYQKGLPLVVVVNTENMKIEFVNVGHDADKIKSTISELLKQ